MSAFSLVTIVFTHVYETHMIIVNKCHKNYRNYAQVGLRQKYAEFAAVI